MEKINCLISGFGGIGYRHLQGILNYQFNGTIFIYDININRYDEGLSKLKNDFNISDFKERIKFINSYEDIKEKIFLLILSGPSNGRLNEYKKIISKINVKFTIVEKLIENNIKDLEKFINLSEKANIFVNTPRRLWPFYKNKIFNEINSIERITIKGSHLNPISNSIHFFDLFFFLFNIFPKKIISISKDIKLFETKRMGYLDVFGKISWIMSNGIIVDFKSVDTSLEPVSMNVITKNSEFKILEVEKSSFKLILLQSTISNMLLSSLHKFNKCNLPKLKDVGFIHKIYTENTLDFFRNYHDENIKTLPST